MRSEKTVFFVLFLKVLTAWADDGPDFSRYPQYNNPGRNPDGTIDISKAMNEREFASLAKAHLAADFSERKIGDWDKIQHAGEPLTLAISLLDHTGGGAYEFFVTRSGHLSYCYRSAFDRSGGEHRQLAEKQFADLRKKISGLPHENSYPAIKDGLARIFHR
jgi:hypothetical protein